MFTVENHIEVSDNLILNLNLIFISTLIISLIGTIAFIMIIFSLSLSLSLCLCRSLFLSLRLCLCRSLSLFLSLCFISIISLSAPQHTVI